jgi:hypothetical protein
MYYKNIYFIMNLYYHLLDIIILLFLCKKKLIKKVSTVYKAHGFQDET